MPDPKVTTACGEVRGGKVRTLSGRVIHSFTGIPYAKPPLGELRFRRSSPFGSWSGTLNATRECRKSCQPNLFFPTSRFFSVGDEDCLYLNVFAPPPDAARNKLPVVVFIHGGGFALGSNETKLYGPEVLLEKNLVLVTMNYRLGTLGFLSLETDEAPGNLGLHDQYLALCWVEENISSFGGNPDNVTVMGESAGAMAALLHTTSPFSRGKLARVIALSGTPSTSFLRNNRSPAVYARAVARRLGCKEEKSESEILKFLQQQDVRKIVRASTILMDWDYASPMPWIPHTDNYSTQPFLPKPFEEAVSDGDTAQIPILYSYCKDEGMLFTSPFYKEPERVKILMSDWDSWAPLLILNRERELVTELEKNACQKIRRKFFPENQIVEDSVVLDRMKDIYTVCHFLQPQLYDARLLASRGHPVYMMRLAVSPSFSFIHMFRDSPLGLVVKMVKKMFGSRQWVKSKDVCHADDLAFIFPFKYPGLPYSIQTEEEKFARDRFLDIIDSFAANGIPHPGVEIESRDSPQTTQGNGPAPGWSQFGASEELVSLEPGGRVDRLSASSHHLHPHLNFWNQLMEDQDLRRPPLSTIPLTIFHEKTAPYRQL